MKPVLIVEDEPIVRESLRDWLRDAGYETETAAEGEEALRKIGEVEYGVMVLDLKLPRKDGLEVLQEAKAQRPQLKGIIITAYPSVETAVKAMKLGAVDYLVKPFAPDTLEKMIQEILGPVQLEIKPTIPKKYRNTAMTPGHPTCMLCGYSGFGNICAFFETGKCVYIEALKDARIRL
jgi:DNA-binding NtrC family response regulator